MAKPRGKPFVKGQVANPTGRPKGMINWSKEFAKAFNADPDLAQEFVRTQIQAAIGGSQAHAKTIMDRMNGTPAQKIGISELPVSKLLEILDVDDDDAEED